jgi:hypothetical protein
VRILTLWWAVKLQVTTHNLSTSVSLLTFGLSVTQWFCNSLQRGWRFHKHSWWHWHWWYSLHTPELVMKFIIPQSLQTSKHPGIVANHAWGNQRRVCNQTAFNGHQFFPQNSSIFEEKNPQFSWDFYNRPRLL